jgi:hypothetical protein
LSAFLAGVSGEPSGALSQLAQFHMNCSNNQSALAPQPRLDADWIRELARQQGAWANIPPKRNRKDPIRSSPYLYRARNLVERLQQDQAVSARRDPI